MATNTGRKLRYVGPHHAVEVPELGTTVARNHQITVEDSALADRLLDQPDNWQEVGAAGKKEADDSAGKDGS